MKRLRGCSLVGKALDLHSRDWEFESPQLHMKEYRCKCGETNKESFMNKGGGRKAYTICKRCHSRNTTDRF